MNKQKQSCVISCPIDTFSGYGSRSRDFVKAIILTKGEEWDIKIMPQRWGDCSWGFIEEHKDEWGFLESYMLPINQPLNTKPDIWFQITVPNEFHPVGVWSCGVTAGIETTIASPEFVDGCNRMDVVIV
jgi:hypothetical protein